MLKDIVRQLRLARGWTQAELAQQIGMHADQIANIERGRSANPKTSTLEALAKAFDMTLAEFIAYYSGAGAMPDPVDQLRLSGYPAEALIRLSEMWPHLTDDDREVVIEVTRSLWERRKSQQGQTGDVARGPKHIGNSTP